MPRSQAMAPLDDFDLDDLETFLEGLGLNVDDVTLRIKEVEYDNGSLQVDFNLKARPGLQDEVGAALNRINRALDGPVGAGNPAIDFNDETPGTPKISDTFRLEFTLGSGVNFIDI